MYSITRESETEKSYERIVALIALLLCCSSVCLAQPSFCEELGVKARFSNLNARLDRVNGNLDSAEVAFAEAQKIVATAFGNENPHCAGECVFGAVSIASRLPRGNELTTQASDSIYAYTTTSTDSSGLAFFLFSAGILEFSRGDRAAARMWFDSAVMIPRRLHAGDNYASTIKVRGFVNRYDGRLVDALSDFQLALSIYREDHNDLKAEIDILAAIADVQVERGDQPAVVLPNIERAIELYEANKSSFVEWSDAYNIYISYAKILGEAGEFERADQAGQDALDLVRHVNDLFREGVIHSGLAQNYLRTKRWELARNHGIMSRDIFLKIGKHAHLADALNTLIEIDRSSGAFEAALATSLYVNKLRDSLASTSQVHEIRRLQQAQVQSKMLSELELEKARGRALLAEQSNAKLTIIGSLVGLVLISVLSILLVLRLRSKRKIHKHLEKIVERRTLELSEHAKELEEKNIELERFAFIASHDLKTPLRNITSFIDLSNRKMSKEAKEDIGEYLEIASNYARQMNHIICDVLEFSKFEGEPRFTTTKLNARLIVEQAVKMTRLEFGHRQPQVSIHGDAELIGNKAYLNQIVSRLVHNALKFNEAAIPTCEVQISTLAEKQVVIRVKDNGLGIEEDYHDVVFDLFRRLNLQEQYPGTGLGLSVARKLARRMKGDVQIATSALGVGSTFELRLPVSKAASIRQVNAIKAIQG